MNLSADKVVYLLRTLDEVLDTICVLQELLMEQERILGDKHALVIDIVEELRKNLPRKLLS